MRLQPDDDYHDAFPTVFSHGNLFELLVLVLSFLYEGQVYGDLPIAQKISESPFLRSTESFYK